MEIGVVLASLGMADHVAAVKKVAELGIKLIQFGGDCAEYFETSKLDIIKKVLDETGVVAVAGTACYEGESYADMPTVTRTVGFANPDNVKERVEKTKEFADFAAAVGCRILTTHIGVVPEDEELPLFAQMLRAVREAADYCDSKGLYFGLETGQETAKHLERFIEEVGRRNVRVNFDPANMILYGSGDPLEAVEILQKHIISSHLKDGKPPTEPEKLGSETPLGEGDVNIPAYMQKLKEVGFHGPLIIEREAGADPIGDIVRAKELLESLR